jgi:hypothetical protein
MTLLVDQAPTDLMTSPTQRQTNILLFGDGTVDPVACLHDLARDAKYIPSLEVFLRATAAALRSQLARIDSPWTSKYPSFDTILALAQSYDASNVQTVAIFPVLLCISQIGVLIR